MGKNQKIFGLKNMKNHKTLTAYVLTIIATFIGIMTYIRLDNDRRIPQSFYRNWAYAYIKSTPKYAYVDTTPQANNDVALSESQGYGMLITALAAKYGYTNKKSFDALYNYYLEHREIINKKPTQLMSWKQTIHKHKLVNEKNTATDGDLYITQSLIVAHHVWPQDTRYLKQAKTICHDILTYEYNPENTMLTVGNWATKKSTYYNLMRTSDTAPEIFDNFYKITGNTTWLNIKKRMLIYLNQLSHQHKSGLVPDFAWVKHGHAIAVKGKVTGSKYDGAYYSNACRVPMLLATSTDSIATDTLYRMLNFFKKQQTLTAGYTLKGKPLNNYQSQMFSSPILMAVMNHHNQGYDQLFSSQQYVITQGLPKDNYYPATITTLVTLLLHKK